MKKKALSSLLITTILLSACTSEVPAETLESIYVDRDDLMYAQNEVLETVAETTESTKETSEITTTEAEAEETTTTQNNAVPTATTTKPKVETPIIKESILNTTVDEYIDANFSFDYIEVTIYKPVEEYVTVEEEEIDLGEYGTTTITVETPVSRTGVSHKVDIKESPYMLYRQMFGHSQNLEVTDNEPIIFDIRSDDKNPYDFLFRGIEHQYSTHYLTIQDENGNRKEYTGNEDEELLGTYDDGKIYFEVQDKDNSIFEPKGFNKVTFKQLDYAKIKAVATRLPSIAKLDSEGNAVLYKDMFVYYNIKLPKEDKEHRLTVGMTMQSIYELIGEGTIIEGTNILKEKGSEKGITEDVTEEVKLHVYKTKDYTLVIEEKEFPDLKPTEGSNAPEKTVLANTIILIQNNVEFNKTEVTAYTDTTTTPSEA